MQNNYAETFDTAKNSLFSKQVIPNAIFFLAVIIPTLLITNQVIGSLLIFSIAWLLFFQFLRRLRYSYLAWWALLIYLVYTAASYSAIHKVPVSDIWYLGLFSTALALVLILVFDILNHSFKIIRLFLGVLLSFSLLIIPLTYISYALTFEIPLSESQLFAIYQTTLSESSEFMGMHSSVLVPVIILGTFILATFFLFKQLQATTDKLTGKVFFRISIFILAVASINLAPHIPTVNLVLNSYSTYQKEVSDFRAELEKRKMGDIKVSASKENTKELYVVIIGESLNKNHMGVYGYPRNTTPHLSELNKQGKLIKFDQAFSNHVHTVPTLTYALTEKNQINQKSFNESFSLLDIQEAAGFESYWISNQVAYGGWDNLVSILAERADHRINVNRNVGMNIQSASYDIELVTELEDILSQPLTKNTVVYLHLLGNHGGYENRYPDSFEKFKGKLEVENFGSKDYWSYHINIYDNSVLYNDYVVSKIIETTQNFGGVSSCVYFSDHSEDVLTHKGHDQGSFTFPMAQIPMLVWVSDEYESKYPNKVTELKHHQQSLFSNGFIYDFMIGFSGIETEYYDNTYDLSNANYSLSIENSFTLHKEHKINETENYFYFNKANIAAIKSRGESARIYPHRVNSKGKLSTVLYDGCTSFELDLVFRDLGDSSYFEVGHDEAAMSGISFEELLSFASDYEIEKIWLDLKNLNKYNIPLIITRLDYLSNKFNLKEKIIVESGTRDIEFSKVSALGYHTSYYLPTGIKDANDADQKKAALEIAKLIKAQKTSAISFDYQLYPFVKNHLENQIPTNIIYHTWNTTLHFDKPDFIPRLEKTAYYNDSRVKTIIAKYHSNFEL